MINRQVIGFIGSGAIGATLARLTVRAGLNAVISNSRGPASLGALIEELDSYARAATVDEVTRACELIVVSVPYNRYLQLPAESLAGKCVVDTMNYYPHRDESMPGLEDGQVTPSELVQKHLRASQVVKGMNNLDYRHLGECARPAGDPQRSALPIAGDDPGAKQLVANFLNAIGFDSVDVGLLREGWRFGPGMPAYALPYIATSPSGLTEEEQRRWFREAPGATVSSGQLKRLIESAQRGMPIARIPGYAPPVR